MQMQVIFWVSWWLWLLNNEAQHLLAAQQQKKTVAHHTTPTSTGLKWPLAKLESSSEHSEFLAYFMLQDLKDKKEPVVFPTETKPVQFSKTNGDVAQNYRFIQVTTLDSKVITHTHLCNNQLIRNYWYSSLKTKQTIISKTYGTELLTNKWLIFILEVIISK